MNTSTSKSPKQPTETSDLKKISRWWNIKVNASCLTVDASQDSVPSCWLDCALYYILWAIVLLQNTWPDSNDPRRSSRYSHFRALASEYSTVNGKTRRRLFFLSVGVMTTVDLDDFLSTYLTSALCCVTQIKTQSESFPLGVYRLWSFSLIEWIFIRGKRRRREGGHLEQENVIPSFISWVSDLNNSPSYSRGSSIFSSRSNYWW